MYKSMYDILNKKIDYENEFSKLWNMLFTKKYYQYSNISYTLIEMFDKLIVNWKYKGTKCSAEEVVSELGIYDLKKLSIQEAILRICDFIINVREFVKYQKKEIDNEINKIMNNRYNSDVIELPSSIELYDKMMVDLVYELLDGLNYEVIQKEDYQCFIIKKNVDAEETAKVLEDEELSSKILQYNNYSIVNDLDAKKSILISMADYFEGNKFKIKNNDLEKNISFALNNFNIRHNNKIGKNENEFIKKISDDDLINLYDETYFMLLISFRLIALPEIQANIEKIRKEEFNK
ncbi:MAG: hypothetical protein IKF38_06130 [Clostridia bacterium]|nr:hypothetical protein [Clostridia bacterium]